MIVLSGQVSIFRLLALHLPHSLRHPFSRARLFPSPLVAPRNGDTDGMHSSTRFVAAEYQELIMSLCTYRGFEIYPLIYPHVAVPNGSAHNYDGGFDAAVKICRRGTGDTLTQSKTFRLHDGTPFDTSGDARRASLRYAEAIIDDNRETHGFFSNAL